MHGRRRAHSHTLKHTIHPQSSGVPAVERVMLLLDSESAPTGSGQGLIRVAAAACHPRMINFASLNTQKEPRWVALLDMTHPRSSFFSIQYMGYSAYGLVWPPVVPYVDSGLYGYMEAVSRWHDSHELLVGRACCTELVLLGLPEESWARSVLSLLTDGHSPSA